jgi:hypothetical protein
MVSITGLEFAYSQAPVSMKGLVMAAWLMTVAVGNLFVALIAETVKFDNDVTLYFFYAGMMMLFNLLFAGINWNYDYRTQMAGSVAFEGGIDEDAKGVELEEYEAGASVEPEFDDGEDNSFTSELDGNGGEFLSV